MSEPYWIALGSGGAVDYAGAWAAGTAYPAGSVVTYAGVTYIAVNPSTGQTPPTAFGSNIPVVTALPGGPVDGQEVILVDSLTAPTYQWRLRYVAGIADAYKWVFVGGTEAYAAVDTSQTTASVTATDLATVGPSIIVPRAGIYMVNFTLGLMPGVSADPKGVYAGIKVGAAATPDDVQFIASSGIAHQVPTAGSRQITAAALDVVKLQYRSNNASNTASFWNRRMQIQPVRIG